LSRNRDTYRDTSDARYPAEHPENLRRGQFIVVTGVKLPETRVTPFGIIAVDTGFNGHPLRVLEIAPPFIAVDDADQVFAIDMREVEFRRVNTRYAQAMFAATETGREISEHECRRAKSALQLAVEAKRRIQNAHPHDCPQCFNRMVRRRTVGCPDFRLVCKECGFEMPWGPTEERA